MGGLIGFLLGGTIAMYGGGHLAAWCIRKISGVTNNVSYVIGLSIMTFVGAWAITYDEEPTSFLKNWILYVVTGFIAFWLMNIRDRARKQRPSA